MPASKRATSVPSLSRPEPSMDTKEFNFQVAAECIETQPAPVKCQGIPHEFLVGLTSTVGNRSTLGKTTHHRHCEDSGIRRPDAVWHYPFGREKYKHLLEQPMSLIGAGRDISFLCDAMVSQRRSTPLPPVTEMSIISETQNLSVSESLFPEEYHFVKNKGIRCLEFYEDAFTVQVKDEEQKLRVLPSMKPTGRLEVFQLMSMMDDMLEKAGVDQQTEESTEASQLQGLLDLVKVEQNIYNIIFHEVIRQVSVGCAERGQLLAKLRQRYQSLLAQICLRLKAFHSEAVAQRALDRRLTDEIQRIKTYFQLLSTELSKIRDHDAFASQEAEHAYRHLAEALNQANNNSDVVQDYHKFYELHRARLKAQLLQITEDRDYWTQFTFCLALKVISLEKMQLFSQLHVSEQSWFKTAEDCTLHLTSKDTEDLHDVIELADCWKKQLAVFMSQLKETEDTQCAEISATREGIAKWLCFCTVQNRRPNPKYDSTSVEEIRADLEQWSDMLALWCEPYQGEKQLRCQQTLKEISRVQRRILELSFQLLRRHPSPNGDAPEGQQALTELHRLLSELLKQLDTQVNGDTGIHGKIMSLLRMMESWNSKIGAVIEQQEMMPESDWLKLEKALTKWLCLAEEALQLISETENKKDQNNADLCAEIEKAQDKMQDFKTNLSEFTVGENQRLHEEVNSIHMAQTRWMLEVLLLTLPDHSEGQNQEQAHDHITMILRQTVDEDAKMLSEKLEYLSSYISSSCSLILEEQSLLSLDEPECENKCMDLCRKLQSERVQWVETSVILLSGVHGGPVELTSDSNVLVCPADDMETQSTAEEHETQQEGELTVCVSPVVRQISYDRSIVQRKLGESYVQLSGTDELIVSPVTEDAQRAFSDLTTVGFLQKELHDSEVRVMTAEQRALKAEEALQEALEKILDLNRQLQGRLSLEPKTDEETKKPLSPPPPPVPTRAPRKKSISEVKPITSTKKTKKR
ncbi:axonemal dynein light chain domain-containing protein 1 [Brachyistius frenatus]|uniref:axonemal dynein light chain domain-containing protein 1 n=1 Tax=Brachyistius frenatus TaxID=100188 RepID=UPI0037E95254